MTAFKKKSHYLYLFMLLQLLLTACTDQQAPTEQLNLTAHYASIDFKVISISEHPYKNKPALRVDLSVPLDAKTEFNRYFKVTDKKGQPVDGHWILSKQGKQVFFPGVEPNSEYKVVVFKGLPAITEKTLLTDKTETIKTRDLMPFVDFASDGSLIPSELVKGLPVISVNINQVDVDFYRVKSDKISQFLGDWRGHSSSEHSWDFNDYHQYTDLVYSGRFDLNPPKNQRYTTHLDIKGIKPLKESGVYLAIMQQAGQYNSHQVTYFTISDIGVHVRNLAGEINVYVSSIETGEELAGIELQFLDKQGHTIAELSSNEQGQAKLQSLLNRAKVLVATDNNHTTVLKLKRAALDLSEFDIKGKHHKPLELFVYGPRDMYRPGETVDFNGLLRNYDGEKVSTPPLKVALKRPDGQAIHHFIWQPDETGLYHYEFRLPQQARTGQWQLHIAMPDGENSEYLFDVEDFLPERMALQLGDKAQAPFVLQNQALNVAVDGRYLYGAPASGNKVTSQVVLKANRKPLNSFKDFIFGDVNESIPFSKDENYEPKALVLDEKGKGSIAIDSKWSSVKNTPVKIALSASLYETGGRAINRFVNYTYWPQQALLGIKPLSDLEALTENSSVEFELINVNHQGDFVKAEAVVTLIHEQRDYFWENTDGNWQQRYTENNSPVFVEQVSLTAKKTNKLKLPIQQGQYLLQIKNTKTGQLSALRFSVGHQWGDISEKSARPDRVRLQWDKPAYLPGDIAQLKIIPPHAGKGFVLLENSQKALWFKRINVPAKGLTLDIPVDKSWDRHDIYATTVVFKAGDIKQKITPNRAVGIVHLKLDKTARELQVEVLTDHNKIRPETTLSTHIKVLNNKAEETVYVTLAAVDVGVLSISHFTTPKPQKHFWAKRRYAVDQHDMYGNIVEIMDAGLTKARFGGDASEDDGTMPRTDVKIVSLFTGPVKLNEQGEADIPLDIPDFNGKLRLMALAYSDNRFGAAENYITVAAPVIAEAAMPRFLAGGDESTLTLDILNQSGEQQTLSLAIDSTGPVKISAEKQVLLLKDQQKKILRFPLKADNHFAKAEFKLTITNGDEAKEKITIKRQWNLAVRPAYPAESKIINLQIPAKSQRDIKLPLDSYLLNSTQASLTLSTQPPLNIAEQLSELLTYPYGCLEQTTSTSYPWLFLNKQRIAQFNLNTIKVDGNPLDLSKRTEHINRSIIRLAGMQRSNGSFGLWDSDSNEEHWLTAYVSDFLLDAREQGFNVPEPLLNKAFERLVYYVNYEGGMYSEPYSPFPQHSRFAFKAYAGYVLARVNRAPLGSLRTLYDHHRKQAKSGLPLVHLGLALITQGDTKRGNAAIEQALKVKRHARVYLADYGSPLRDFSLMTYLLNKHKVAAADTLIFQLAGRLKNRQYLSTQERNALFLVAVELATDKDKRWSAELLLNKTKQVLKQSKAYQQRFVAEAIPQKLSIKSTDDKTLFMQLGLKGYPKQAPEKEEDTFLTERHYYSLNRKAIDLDQLKVGDLMLVHLKVKAKERIKQALVVDLLPAGFELENQNLENSIQLSDLPIRIEGDSIEDLLYNTKLDYQQYRDDRYVAALDMREGQVNNLFYLVRMVTPGIYTVPPVYIEDMYRPYIRGIGRANPLVKIVD